MRKWVVIGILLLGIAAIVTFVATRPKHGSVEWHKREYQRAWRQAIYPSLRERVRESYRKLLGDAINHSTPNLGAEERWISNQAALVRHGFLIERKYAVTNRSSYEVLCTLWGNNRIRELAETHFTYVDWCTDRGVQEILVTAPREAHPKVEALIRQADVVESGK